MADAASLSIQQLFDLTGRGALVTGSASGIGFGIASRLAEAGAGLVVADLNGEAAEMAAQKLREQGRLAQAVPIDVRSAADVRRAVDLTAATYGGLDILVNNAGIYPTRPLQQITEVDWDRVVDINLKGTFLCSQAAINQMIAQGRGGVIINIASIDAVHPSGIGLAHYGASKGGVLMLTRNLALEVAPHRIRVVAIAPGSIATEGSQAGAREMESLSLESDEWREIRSRRESFRARIPLGRRGEPDDIGRVALFLASDAAAYMTGTAVFVDGGVLLT